MSEASEKPRLFILIQGKYYLCERIPFGGERQHTTGWKLTKMADKFGHSPYCVIKQPSGRFTCECADFTFVQNKVGGTQKCKHIDACVDIFGPSLRGF